MSAAAAPRQLPTLTGLRGIAALAVLFYHIRASMGSFAPEWMIALLGHGYLAVDLFFVLSGFILWWTYGAAFREQGRAATLPFIVRRFARIFPLHLAIMLAMIAFAGVLVLSGRPLEPQYPLGDLPAHLLLVQNWGFSDRLAWNDPAWSISAEWAAYLLLALGGTAAARLGTGARRFPLLTLAIATAIGTWFAATGRSGIGADIPATGLVRCLAEFGIGVLLCQWWSENRDCRALVLVTAAGLAILGTALIVSGVSQPAGVPLLMAAIVTIALEASLSPRPLLGGRTAQWLGQISYALYLTHFFLWILFKLLFVTDPAAVSAPAIAAFVAATLLSAHLLHRHIELPGRRWCQRVGDDLLAALHARRARG
ncbi:MAG: acyltransferase [Sphingopyxis sp.]|nr:acyltransferase [Sphingopyxis sp.]